MLQYFMKILDFVYFIMLPSPTRAGGGLGWCKGKQRLAFCGFFLLFLTGCALNSNTKTLQIELSSCQIKNFFVEIASTPETRTKGLMFRKNLPENKGMFFVFEKSEVLSFWMKNTLIPLDIIFLDRDKKIINIKKMALPCAKDPCPLFSSVAPAEYVLEIGGGLSDKFGVTERARLSLK